MNVTISCNNSYSVHLFLYYFSIFPSFNHFITHTLSVSLHLFPCTIFRGYSSFFLFSMIIPHVFSRWKAGFNPFNSYSISFLFLFSNNYHHFYHSTLRHCADLLAYAHSIIINSKKR